jgi:hypothetical protein
LAHLTKVWRLSVRVCWLHTLFFSTAKTQCVPHRASFVFPNLFIFMGSSGNYWDRAIEAKEKADRERYANSFLYTYLRVSEINSKLTNKRPSLLAAIFCTAYLTVTHLVRTTFYWLWTLIMWPFSRHQIDPRPVPLDDCYGNMPNTTGPLPTSPLPNISHEIATLDLPNVKFSGSGFSIQDPLRMEPSDMGELKYRMRQLAKIRMPDTANLTDDFLDGMAAEYVKIAYLEARFGKQERDWSMGQRHYYKNTIQSQQIILTNANGKAVLIYFDFSAFHGPFTKEEYNKEIICVDKNQSNGRVVLINQHGNFVVDSLLLNVLLINAKQNGWSGGDRLFKVADGHLIIEDSLFGCFLNEAEAKSFGYVLTTTCNSAFKNHPEMKVIWEFADFCNLGGFAIQKEPKN